MKVLVVYCHPVETSYNAEIHRVAVDALKRAGHEVEDLDLYAEDFNPVLSRAERLDYHDLTKNSALVGKYVAQLRRAEALVFVYPTWTYGLPAMLKGWFDRVMLPGVSFRLGEDGIARPNLQHIRRVVGISTYGRPWWVATFLMGNPPRKNIVRYFRLVTGGRARTKFIAHYDMNRSTDRTRADFLAKVERTMAGLE
ncbi:MAG: NAD(P)H-dependent oxidoreductase [Rhodospirillales bacterium]|nr:NAD(P)H-dependent oxidoreductase [Rhodospirillales bacterium]